MRSGRLLCAAVLILAGLLVSGCASGPRTYSVKGKVTLAGGDVAHLAGCNVDAMSADDPNIRTYGVIQEDGSFTLETLQGGKIVKGAQEGKYKVRIVLSDDDPAVKRKARAALAPQYLKFETSGLSFQVPAEGEVVLNLSTR